MVEKITEEDIAEGVYTNKPLENKSEAEIKKLAMDLYKGNIFTSLQVRDINLESIFMPLLLLDSIQLRQLSENGTYTLYEYLEKASPRSINGYPCFFSFHCLNKHDSDLLISFYNEIREKFKDYE